MRALVTGASGFLGSTLIEELGKQGSDCVALLRSTSSVSNLEGLKFSRADGSLSDLESLKRAVREVDVVYHLAGVTTAPSRAGFFEHNAQGTERVARAVAEANPGLKRFVLVSSLAAGGPSSDKGPRTETDVDGPVSNYGHSKLQGEKELLKYKDVFPVTIVRPPIVYGPRDKAVFTVIQTVSRGLMPLMSGAGSGGNKFYTSVHARDLVRALVLAGEARNLPSGEVFYVCSKDVHTYRDLLESMAAALGRSAFRVPVPRSGVIAAAALLTGLGKVTGKTFPLNWDKLSELLPDYWTCSPEKAKRLLGFQAEFGLRDGMADTIRWYKERGWL
jgi:nucleoside-diphosphate-sugar epimerase